MTGFHQISLRLRRGADFELSIDLRLQASGVTVLLGPSGSGKTSVLRCVAGLERAESARLVIGGEVWEDRATGLRIPAWQRPIGYVFQEARLFPHLDVRGNLEFGLRRPIFSSRVRHPGAFAGTARPEPPAHSQPPEQSLDSAITSLGIGHLLKRRPDELSGGERQRVAIARALVTQPQLLLLDEPLSALDVGRRQEVLPWLEGLRDRLGLPMLYVTHSMEEMARLANTVVLMEAGRARACGPVADVMREASLAAFASEEGGTLIEARVTEHDLPWHLMRVEFPGGALWLRSDGSPVGRGVRLRVLARDVSLATTRPSGSSIQNQLACRIESLTPDPQQPGQVFVTLRCGEGVTPRLLARITARAAYQLDLSPGLDVWAQVKAVALVG